MKKLILILVAIIGFGFSANAGVVFRSQQSVCYSNEQVVFKSNGTVEMWMSGELQLTGTYTIEGNVIIMTMSNGRVFRTQASMNDSKTTLFSLTFNSFSYTRCTR